jgi:xanthine dehydrogenase accessory factor
MRDLLADYHRLARNGPVGRAVVTSVWGSAPRPEGACLLALPDGTMAGSVSGGCVESAVVEEIGQAIARGTPRLVRYSVSNETAWEVGLACGGTIEVLIEPSVRPEILKAAESGGVVIPAVIAGPGELTPEQQSLIAPHLHDSLVGQTSFAVDLPAEKGEAIRVFLEFFPRQATLLVYGATHVAMTLVPLAKQLGYRVVVADGRAAFLTRERFPTADELVLAWPAEAFAQVGIDPGTYLCILSHDPKFDEAALEIALRSDAAYVGAIGSKKTQQARRQQLASHGFSPAEIQRLHGPIGLDLGGKEPAEIALAILAEMTMAKHGKA